MGISGIKNGTMQKIILIDDDEDILDAFKLVFERAGYEVTAFNRGEYLLTGNFTEPDIFIIDKQLTGADGLDLCRYLKNRALKKNTPVIVFSATPRIGTLAQAAGADDFLEKPFKTKTLLEMVRKHIGIKAA